MNDEVKFSIVDAAELHHPSPPELEEWRTITRNLTQIPPGKALCLELNRVQFPRKGNIETFLHHLRGWMRRYHPEFKVALRNRNGHSLVFVINLAKPQ
jgi:hypothetical protein